MKVFMQVICKKESQVYNNSPQQDYYPEEEVSKAIAEDSPYNIKRNGLF